MSVRRNNLLFYVSLSASVVVADAWTKGLVEDLLVGGSTHDLLPFLHLVLVYNRGAAFGFLSSASGWQNQFFIVVSIVVSIFILIRIVRVASDGKWFEVALVFILGGAVGNLIDRIRLGYVVDFIELYYGNWQFPAFNIADMAIFTGAVMLIADLLQIRPRRKSHR